MVRGKRPPRLIDVAIPPPYPGEHVAFASILDREVVITAFTLIPSQFKHRLDYLAVQIERDRRQEWFATQSGFIINFFERVSQESLPCRAVFSQAKDADGNYTYFIS